VQKNYFSQRSQPHKEGVVCSENKRPTTAKAENSQDQEKKPRFNGITFDTLPPLEKPQWNTIEQKISSM
jgi:hypothetical protein